VPLEQWLPSFNAGLIVVSGIFLVVGFVFIKRNNVQAHRRSMLSATVFAGLFLVVYVTRWFVIETKLFPSQGWIKTLYLSILVPHIVLAMAIVPLVLVTLKRALSQDFERHKRIARLTFPIWLFVAVSGWVVYWMLYSQ